MEIRYAIYLCAFIICFKCVQSKIVQGEFSTAENWKFISRFCFMSEAGTLQYEFEYPEEYLTQNLLLYWDRPDLWTSVYKSSLTCQERQSKLRSDYSQIFTLSHGLSSCVRFNTTIYCKSTRIQFRTQRERWWYLVIANCDGLKGLKLKYKVWMRNGNPGDTFFEHFSADEFYILQTDISFLLAEIAVFVVVVVFAVKLLSKNMFHSTYRMFFISVLLRCFYLLFSCIKWGVYANNGQHDDGLTRVADVLGVSSLLLFILMLMLMALGYTIVCGRLPTWMVISLFVFMIGIGVTYVVLFIYEALVFDPGWVLYRYESKPGLGIMGLLILCWVGFIVGGMFTAVTHPKKRTFYIPFLIFFTVWFWAVPTLVFISIWHIPLWMRMKVVNGVECTIIFLGHLFYLWLTRPTDNNNNFPYHIRTQQIDTITLEEATDKALDAADDNFNMPSFNPDIFTVQSGHPEATTNVSQPPKSTNPFLSTPSSAPQAGSQRETMTNLGHMSTSSPEGDTQGETETQLSPSDDNYYIPRNLDSMFSFPSRA